MAELGGVVGGEKGGADDFDDGTGGSEVEVLQRKLSLTLTELARVSTEVGLFVCARVSRAFCFFWGGHKITP